MTTKSPVAATKKPSTTVKVKKVTSTKNASIPPSHPKYIEMIKEAIASLKERTGSSQFAIAKFLEEHHKTLPGNFRKQLLVQLRNLVASEKLVKVKNSYKLPSTRSVKADSTAPAKKKPAVKKSVAKAKTAVVSSSKAVTKKAKPVVKASVKSVVKSAKVAKTTTMKSPGKKVASAKIVAAKKVASAKIVAAKKVAVVKKKAPGKSVKAKTAKSSAKKGKKK